MPAAEPGNSRKARQQPEAPSKANPSEYAYGAIHDRNWSDKTTRSFLCREAQGSVGGGCGGGSESEPERAGASEGEASTHPTTSERERASESEGEGDSKRERGSGRGRGQAPNGGSYTAIAERKPHQSPSVARQAAAARQAARGTESAERNSKRRAQLTERHGEWHGNR